MKRNPYLTRILSHPYYTLGRFVDTLSSKLHRFNIENTIVISGTPRGGTTWLMEILGTLEGYKTIFEPLNPDNFPEARNLSIPRPRPYLPPYVPNLELKKYLELVFSGKIVSSKPHYRPKEIHERITSDNLVVKFIGANRLLLWIYVNFNLRAIYLLIRHPCATISSQVNTGIYGIGPEYQLNNKLILKQISLIPDLRDNDWLIKKIKSIETKEEVLAAIWALDNYVPLSYLYNNPNAWYVVLYERLLVDFEEELKNIFGYIGERVPKKAFHMKQTPSMLAYETTTIGTPVQVSKWKNKLSVQQIRNILKVVHWFGLDFYTEDPEPDYDAVKNWEPPF